MAKTNWTRAMREWVNYNLPTDHLLPDSMPSYVDSYVYLFGVLTLAAFIWVIVSGTVLAIFGPDWWHVSTIGHFFNSLHFWAVQSFFFFMILHLWAQFLMAAWRGGRHFTWMGGWLLFLISILAGFTGYLSQNNFDSEWVGSQGKDAMNSVGVGGFFNLLNFGQMYGLHIFVIPLVIIGLIAIHVLLVRIHGVVEPIPIKGLPDPATDEREV